MEENQIITNYDVADTENLEYYRISVGHFVILSIVTCGIYELWWIYKTWQFFQDKEHSDIKPGIRALFSVIFLIPLFNKIKKLANGDVNYYSVLLFLGFFIINSLSLLPDPYFLIAIFSIVFLIIPFRALNYAVDYCEDVKVLDKNKFSTRQIILLILGSFIWILYLAGHIIK